MKLCFATNNKHKIEEVADAIQGKFTLISLEELHCFEELPETQTTIEGNSLQKADYVFSRYNIPCFADDTGLEVDALGGRPGVYAARYAGLQASYEDNCRKLLKELAGVPRERRTARFVTVAVVAAPSEKVQVTAGRLDGLITEVAAGAQGFGYDPVFYVPDLGKTLAELSSEEKNRISHRAKAFAQVRELLQKRLQIGPNAAP